MSRSELTSHERATERDTASVIGARVPSKLGRKLVTGHGTYVDDISLPGMLHGRFVRSQYAHARVTAVDTSEVAAMDGVVLVWTAADIDPYVERFGVQVRDEEALVTDIARYVGDEIALVVAEDRNTAIEAADRVRVEYEKLDVVTTAEDALAEGAPLVHPELAADEESGVVGNLVREYTVQAGDVEDAFKTADIIIEESFQTNKTNPCPLEPHGCVADYNPGTGTLTIWTPNQAPHLFVTTLANALVGIESGDIVCKVPDVGGAFGVKIESLTHEVCAAALARHLERPVKIVLDRLEDMQVGRGRADESFDAKLAATSDGRLVGMTVDMVQNTGARVGFGLNVALNPMTNIDGPYLIPNQRATAKVVYTNLMPSTAVRGFGDPQFTFVREQLVDMAAAALGMDPIELRLKNIVTKDEMPIRTPTGLLWQNIDLPECVRRVREMIDWDAHTGGYRTDDGKLRGVGFAALVKRNGNRNSLGFDLSQATVQMDVNGRVTVRTGIASIGQGTETGIAQIVAETLGVSVERVTPVVGDTDSTPYDLGVWADRGIVFAGSAAAMAAEQLKETIVTLAAHRLGVDEAAIALADDRIFERENPENGLDIEAFVRWALFGGRESRPAAFRDGVVLQGQAVFETQVATTLDPETNHGNLGHSYTHGALAVLVEIDPGTGDVAVIDVAVSEDLGRVINPSLVEGQVHGCIAHAIGDALLERMAYDETGILQNGTLVDYHLPTSVDVPMISNISEVESPDPATHFGQRGVGESSLLPVTAAIANAIYDATGLRFCTLPITPDQLLVRLIDEGVA
ncbi:xanthine dehydrogenase family protein molybdopterin-binding subunit [Haladaptatus sp. DJG-WS-42]|uniref:xanthine dehydrogenase family protein molybdopterin-binding subunit n=1 Tax=Haladaptatus sp. DJG-WS-42 TaxID=3120516 RepID=UPI0030CAA00D